MTFFLMAFLLFIFMQILISTGHCIVCYSKLWYIGVGIALQKIKC